MTVVVTVHEMFQTRRDQVAAVNLAGAALAFRSVVARVPSICGSSYWWCFRVKITARDTSSGPTASEESSSCSTRRRSHVSGVNRRTSRAWTMRRWDVLSGLTDCFQSQHSWHHSAVKYVAMSKKNCVKLFLSELCQVSTNCENF